MLCAQSPMHLAESVTPSGSGRLLFSTNIGIRN